MQKISDEYSKHTSIGSLFLNFKGLPAIIKPVVTGKFNENSRAYVPAAGVSFETTEKRNGCSINNSVILPPIYTGFNMESDKQEDLPGASRRARSDFTFNALMKVQTKEGVVERYKGVKLPGAVYQSEIKLTESAQARLKKTGAYSRVLTMPNSIKGITINSLYVNELLNVETLVHVMNSIKRIQSTEIDNARITTNVNSYYNYASKLKNRYESYDYSKFKNHKETFHSLFNELTSYETSGCGKCVIIHGDPVMTNILVNNFGKIKFIDMRGKLGDVLTIYGDFLYDWAKLYQSLIGYDKILTNKYVSHVYESTMIKCFEKYFIELYSEKHFAFLKSIVKSLLFTLIPLHNNDLCFKYYELINKV
jgi:hypothetical protein